MIDKPSIGDNSFQTINDLHRGPISDQKPALEELQAGSEGVPF